MRTVRDLLESRDFNVVQGSDSVRDAVNALCARKTGAVLVKEGDAVAGIFTERDLMHRVINEGLDPDGVSVASVMSTKLIHVHMDDELRMAKALMVMSRVRHVLVEGNDRELLGLLSMRDIIEMEVKDSSEFIHDLNDKYYEESYKAKWWISSNRVLVERYQPKV